MTHERRNIVITGVSRGLGSAITAQFIAGGHRLAGCARNEHRIADLSTQFPAPNRFDVVDVSRNDQVEAWAADVIGELGPPDLLINNAALINANAPLWDVPVTEFSRVIDVNIKGIFHVLKVFLPPMLERQRGVIVNLSSGWGRATSAEVAPYCATKWAVEGLTQSLSQELPAGMAAIAVNPGIINTEMLQSCFGAGASGYPTAESWAVKAAPFMLNLSGKDNGRPLTV